MEEVYKEAFVEVLDIINHTELELVNKISKSFLKFLEDNKSLDYESNINFNNINWQDTVKPQTQEVIALIYRDYLVSDEKRIELTKEAERELAEKYSYDKLFQNHTVITSEHISEPENDVSETNLVVQSNEKWYSKIWNFIKGLFRYKK